MTTLLFSLAAGGGVLIASQAQAADTFVTREYYAGPAPVVENIRTLCDQFGRCWRERIMTRTVIESPAYDYDYAPRPPAVVERRVYQTPAYYADRPAPYYEAPAAGVGVYAPGLSVGVGVGER